jgi:hypothetical protein
MSEKRENTKRLLRNQTCNNCDNNFTQNLWTFKSKEQTAGPHVAEATHLCKIINEMQTPVQLTCANWKAIINSAAQSCVWTTSVKNIWSSP